MFQIEKRATWALTVNEIIVTVPNDHIQFLNSPDFSLNVPERVVTLHWQHL